MWNHEIMGGFWEASSEFVSCKMTVHLSCPLGGEIAKSRLPDTAAMVPVPYWRWYVSTGLSKKTQST